MLRRTISISLSVCASVAILVVSLALHSFTPNAIAKPQAELHVCASGCTYTDVQSAVDAATDGDVIKIGTGVYTEAIPVSQMVYITKSLMLRGGYNPPNWTVSNPSAYTTTLDAQGNGRVMVIDGSAITGSITVTVDGLQITGGYWSSTEYVGNWAAPPGGGVRVQSANVIILNSRLYANHTFNGLGSGLFQQSGSFIMQNSTVQENTGTGGNYSPLYGELGGGLFLLQTTASISNSFILSNSAGYGNAYLGEYPYGGGIYLNSSTASIDHTLFQGNVAAQNEAGRGGGLASESGKVTVSNSTLLNNLASQSHSVSLAGGLYLSPYSGGSSVVIGNVFQGNTDGALVVYNGLMTVTANLLQDNSGGRSVAVNFGGGVYLNGSGIFQNNTVISNTAPIGGGAILNGSLAVIGNTFQNNTATGDGGGLVANGAVTLIRNVIQNNTAGGCGGGLLSNGLALEDGDRIQNNTALYGGGLCVKANTGGASYQNLVILDNQGIANGSGVYVDRGSASGAVNLRHLTIGRNTGGDGTGVNFNTGTATFVNTIIYSQAVGVQNVTGTPVFSHTLRYQVLTPTVGTVSDLFATTGDPAFTADGFHLTNNSAAIDAGVTTPVTDDADGNSRPQGSAPDLGAIESPYTRGVTTGVQASKQAGTPHWVMRWDPSGNASSMILQQDYLIPFSYGGPVTSPIVSAYTIKDNFPIALQLSQQEATPAMAFSQVGQQLTWQSTAPLPAGDSGWVGVVGQSAAVQPGANLNNTGSLIYSLATGQTYTVPLQASSQVPVKPLLPPLLTMPMNGEMCRDEQSRLEARGLSYAGLTINLYENNSLKATSLADATGVFTLTWTLTLSTSNSVNIYAEVCDQEACSAPSQSVHLDYPQAFWCPQRSYWEGDVHNMHFVFHFVNEQGHYATNDFELPGVYGFANTQLHLYSCCDRDTNPFTVRADGTVYTTPVQHVGRLWTFNIGAAHDVTIQSQCQVGGNPPPHGVVLIDPDGFVFDQMQGGHYDQATGMYSPTQSIAGITVTAYVSVPEWGGWMPWPAQMYNDQINPQVTKADGYFAFFTPPGLYYLQATGPSTGSGQAIYQSWRSPVIEVITQVVHANVPLTPWMTNVVSHITLSPEGLSPAIITVPLGSSVEWLSALGASPTITDLVKFTDNPVVRLLSARNPFTDSLGFDGGALIPGQAYRWQFSQLGTYSYSDGAGHTGQVVVTTARIYLPLVLKNH